MKTLPELMQTLPQELFDEIYGLVLKTRAGAYRIDGEYKSPHLLQVDRQSRETFAKSYYSKSILIMKLSDFALLRSWLESMPKEHLCILEEVRVEARPEEEKIPFDLDFVANCDFDILGFATFVLENAGVKDADDVFRLQVRFDEKSRTRVTWMRCMEVQDMIREDDSLFIPYSEALNKKGRQVYQERVEKGCEADDALVAFAAKRLERLLFSD